MTSETAPGAPDGARPEPPASLSAQEWIALLFDANSFDERFAGVRTPDPLRFADPDRFDPARPDAGRHLAFSSGVHYCLGASLARAEASIGLRLLHERFPALRPDGEPTRRPTRVLRGYERMPVALR